MDTNMKLNDFVSSTLTAIISGVKEAQAQAQGTGAEIAPSTSLANAEGGSRQVRIGENRGHSSEMVEFDLCIASSSEKSGKFFIRVLDVGGKTAKAAENRVRFRLPIVFPNPALGTKQ